VNRNHSTLCQPYRNVGKISSVSFDSSSPNSDWKDRAFWRSQQNAIKDTDADIHHCLNTFRYPDRTI
jgi:hypothetical protein